MEQYKKDFIDFLWNRGAIKLGEFTLKSGRKSPWFVNLRGLSDGQALRKLGEAYARAIRSVEVDGAQKLRFDRILAPADAGTPLSTATVMMYSEMWMNEDVTWNRKVPKNYGEATKEDFQKSWLYGSPIRDGDSVLLLDDVFTTGQTKYDIIDLVDQCADNVQYSALFIAVDREEVADIDGVPQEYSAIDEFVEKTGIPVYSIVNAREVYSFLKERGRIGEHEKAFKDYLVEYGTSEAREALADIGCD